MAYGKSLELRKIKENPTTIGTYSQVGTKWFRNFKPGDLVYSRDGKTKYLVDMKGTFRKIKEPFNKISKT